MSGVDRKNDEANESALFRAALDDVTPTRFVARATLHPPLPRPIPVQSLMDDHQVLQDSLSDPPDNFFDSGEELQFLRNGLSRDVLRKLRRGKWVIQSQLDLHGMISSEARVALAAFLNHSGKAGARCVRIIHGKGLTSFNREPVLKHKVKHWLTQRDDVLAFAQARPLDGGGGAVVVLLKSSKHSL